MRTVYVDWANSRKTHQYWVKFHGIGKWLFSNTRFNEVEMCW